MIASERLVPGEGAGGKGIRPPLSPPLVVHHPGGAPTVPLDPPTGYALASLFTLVGKDLIRAGRGREVFRAATGFVAFFALTVQYFLFRFTAWMYAYLFPEDAFSLAWVSPAFFLAVLAAGVLGAYVTQSLLVAGRNALAVGNALLGFAAWAIVWYATWEPYFVVGTYAEFHAGRALPSTAVPAFQTATAVCGAAYAVVGLGLAAWMIVAGRRARRAAAMQPEPDDGSWRAALPPSLPPSASPAVVDGEIRTVRPRDGAPLPPVPITPLDQIPSIVLRARKAQGSWARARLDERRERLRAVHRRFLAHAEEFAALLEEEIGRPRAESYITEILPSADVFDYWIARAPVLLAPRPVAIPRLVFRGKRAVVERVPRGVVGAIMPWNFPLALPLRTLVPALLCGNAVVFKPSEWAPRVGARLHAIFAEQLPAGVLELVQGDGRAGEALVRAGLDQVVFVGSARGGAAVARACAETLTPVSLELGAKDAAIVLEDADLERTAAGIAWAAFGNAGQNCAAIERCLVVEKIRDAFVEALRRELSRLRIGPAPEGEEDVGPLANPMQKRTVESQLAATEGGSRIHGPEPRGGLYVRPTVVIDPPVDGPLLREETFGPVLPVITVRDEEEAVEFANRSPYGLTVSVWSRDLDRAGRLGRRIHAGVITVNNHAFTGSLVDAPWGGVRASGHGVTNGPEFLEELTRPRLVLVDSGRMRRELWWYPYGQGTLDLARALARLRSGAPGKATAVAQALRGLGRRREESR